MLPDRYKSEYWYDANGNIDTLARYDQDGNLYDGFSYKYKRDAQGRLVQNRLYQLNDRADQANAYVNEGPGGAEDIAWTGNVPFNPTDGAINTAYNYGYDELGNLVRDTREEIASIEWTVAGKVKRVERTTGSGREPLTFGYGADGQRIKKQVGEDPIMGDGHREYYVRDAQGNIMATYRYTNTTSASFRVMERPIYGSSRLGSYDRPRQLLGITVMPVGIPMTNSAKRYELTDHLGNVSTVVTGRLLPGNGAGSAYQAEVLSASGFENFGALLPGRNFNSGAMRFGFNGKENDNEWHGSTGTLQDYGMRAYDTRLARFFAVDPLTRDFPWYTPYQFAGNKPIWAVDLDGLEEFFRTDFYVNGEFWKTELSVASDAGIRSGLPSVQRVHNSRADIEGTNVTVRYTGSQMGANVLTDQENAVVNRRTVDADGKVTQYGVGVDPPGFKAFEQTTQSKSNLDDVKERVANKDLEVKHLNPTRRFNEDDSKKPSIELPVGLNAVPKDPKSRKDASGTAVEGSIGYPGLIKPMGGKEDEQKEYRETTITVIGTE